MMFQIKPSVKDGVAVSVYPPSIGNQPSVNPKNQINSSPRKKYGKAEITMKTGGRTLSSAPPRRHAATAPNMVPIRKPRIVLTPTSPSDHGRAWAMT